VVSNIVHIKYNAVLFFCVRYFKSSNALLRISYSSECVVIAARFNSRLLWRKSLMLFLR
jgi:hypothetical protein